MIEFVCGITAGIVLTKKLKVLEKIKIPNIPKLPKFKVIVKINDDKYAIRRGYVGFYFYKDLIDGKWRTKFSEDFEDCLGSEEKVLKCIVPNVKSETVVDL